MRCLVMFITAVCLIFLLKLKWPKNKSVYDLVYERYGHATLKVVRDYEKESTANVKFINESLRKFVNTVETISKVYDDASF